MNIDHMEYLRPVVSSSTLFLKLSNLLFSGSDIYCFVIFCHKTSGYWMCFILFIYLFFYLKTNICVIFYVCSMLLV